MIEAPDVYRIAAVIIFLVRNIYEYAFYIIIFLCVCWIILWLVEFKLRVRRS